MTLSVDDVRFPGTVERRANGVRSYKTKIFEAPNGYEGQRRAVFTRARREWVIESVPVGIGGITASDIMTIMSMFECAQGQVYGFKFKPKNPADYILGATTTVSGQLYKIYETKNAANVVVRQLLRPIYYVDPTNSAHFLTPVRFDMDGLEDEMVGDDQTLVLPTIRIRELLLS